MQFGKVKRTKNMYRVFLAKRCCRAEMKCASSIKNKGGCSAQVFKSNLQAADLLADLSLQTDIGMIVAQVIPAEIQFAKGLHIPFLIARTVTVFTMPHHVNCRKTIRS